MPHDQSATGWTFGARQPIYYMHISTYFVSAYIHIYSTCFSLQSARRYRIGSFFIHGLDMNSTCMYIRLHTYIDIDTYDLHDWNLSVHASRYFCTSKVDEFKKITLIRGSLRDFGETCERYAGYIHMYLGQFDSPLPVIRAQPSEMCGSCLAFARANQPLRSPEGFTRQLALGTKGNFLQ